MSSILAGHPAELPQDASRPHTVSSVPPLPAEPPLDTVRPSVVPAGQAPSADLLQDSGHPRAAPAGPSQPTRSLEIRGDEPWPEAGRTILSFHLERMLQRVTGILEVGDAEDVHQMRLSTRRMRAAWRVFGGGYDPETRERCVGDLREIGGALGAVRDLDVRLGYLGAHRDRRSRRERHRLEPLTAAWRAEREARHRELVDLLRGQSFASLVEDYRWLTTPVSLELVPLFPRAPASMRQQVASRIWKAYEAVWAFDGRVENADIATLHELRIAAKRLRYTLEFARVPLEPEGGALIRRVVALQDQLGDVHDLDLAAHYAREFVDGRPAVERDERRAISAFVTTMDQRVTRLRGSLGPRWREVSGAGFRGRLGRGLGRL